LRISACINGRIVESDVDSRTTLADHLRHGLGLTGTHVGCEHGVCGACTVLVDGVTTRSCLMLAVQSDGAQITTVEGVADGERLHPVQQALWQKHGLQCGYCTPGVVMSLCEMLRDVPDPSEEQVRDVLSGHLCRCTGYQNIVAAALEAARVLRGEGAK
jgi:2-furoyl-CoA dehydrogenase 2Fe-2S iron sulfur subunit